MVKEISKPEVQLIKLLKNENRPLLEQTRKFLTTVRIQNYKIGMMRLHVTVFENKFQKLYSPMTFVIKVQTVHGGIESRL